MEKFRFYIACMALFFISCGVSSGQTDLPISMEKVLELTGVNNLTIQEFKIREGLAEAEISKAKEWWLPEVYFGFQTHELWGAAMNANGNFFLDVKRNNLWAGLGIEANWDLAEGIYGSKIANLNLQSVALETQAKKDEETLKTLNLYYDLLSVQMKAVAYDNLVQQTKLIVDQMNLQEEAGLIYQSDFLKAKGNLKHLKVLGIEAQKDHARISAELVKVLNLQPEINLVSVDSNIALLNLIQITEIVSLDSVYTKNPGINLAELNKEIFDLREDELTKGLLLPDIRLNGYGSYFGALKGGLNPMQPELYPEVNQLYPTSALNLSLMWKIPLGQFVYKGDSKKLEFRRALNENKIAQLKSEVNREISTAEREMKFAMEQLILAKEENKIAESIFEHMEARQKLEIVRPYEIVEFQEIYINAKMDLLNATINYNKAQCTLFVARGNNF